MNIYASRRDKLIKDLGNNSIVVLYSNDNEYTEDHFNVNRNFYYLTGIDAKDMALVIENREGVISEKLFIMPFDPLMAKWVGGRMLPEEAEEISEIENIDDYENCFSYLNARLENYRAFGVNIYFDFFKKEDGESVSVRESKKLKKANPWLEVKDIFPHIASLRLVKDEYEIACLKQAVNITRSGIEAMMKSVKPGVNEMVMDGLFTFALSKNLCNETSFKTICASGKRATVLHYSDNNQTMEDGDLLLTDLGATYRHYCGDITRTYPVNGKFTDRQKELYNIVLNANKLVEENAKPGVKIKDLNNMVIKYYESELPKHGLNKPVSEYYYHGISHHIGLDVHDIDGGMGQTLRAGNIISNEPGLYVEDENIGIRIEDDLLITGTGCINLSENIVKEADDIENLIRS